MQTGMEADRRHDSAAPAVAAAPLVAGWIECISSGAPHIIHSDEELERYTEALFELTAKPGLSEPEEQLVELLGVLIERYETERYPVPDASPLDVLNYLMERHEMRQQDLVPLLGTSSLVSLILRGKRNLTLPRIQALAKRFRVSPMVFLSRNESSFRV